MEDVSGVFVDENHPPLPIRWNTGVSGGSETSCKTIEDKDFKDLIDHDGSCNFSDGLKDNAVPGTSSGYICHSSFKREVFIR